MTWRIKAKGRAVRYTPGVMNGTERAYADDVLEPLKRAGDGVKEFVIGIDPGVKTGFAYYSPSSNEWLEVGSVTFHAVMAWADSVPVESRSKFLIVVECAGRMGVVYARLRQAEAVGKTMRKARNVGANNRESDLLAGELERRGFEVVRYVPRNTWKSKVKKWTHEEMQQITGYASRTNEHARDAMRLAWEHRHLLRVKG